MILAWWLDLSAGFLQPLLEVLHHMEAVDHHPDRGPEHHPGRLGVALPHIGRDLRDVGQQAGLALGSEPCDQRLLLAALQHVEHAAVRVIDDHRDEPASPFFKESSSMPIERIGWPGWAAACGLRSRKS